MGGVGGLDGESSFKTQGFLGRRGHCGDDQGISEKKRAPGSGQSYGKE